MEIADIKEEGRIGNLIYIVRNSNIRIPLERIDLKNEELIDKINSHEFVTDFIPKFGKFEAEEFIADELRKAIFITNDLSNLFSTSIIVDDGYSSCFISSDIIEKELIKECLKKCRNSNSQNPILYELKM